MLYLQTTMSFPKLSFILGCFLFGLMLIGLIFMSSNTSFNTSYNNVTDQINSRRQKLGPILLAQLLHNNGNPDRPLNYQNFPIDHPGHLNSEKKMRLVSIIRSSSISDQYRYGSSVGNFYIKSTYRYPNITPEIIGTVLEAESLS